jgi:hypothetical protein
LTVGWASAGILIAHSARHPHEKGDWVAARNVIDTMAAEINKRDYPQERRNAMAEMKTVRERP